MKGDDGLPEEEEWTIDFKDLEFQKRMGSGNFGCVHVGEYLGAKVAIKELLMPQEDPEFTRKYIAREFAVLKNLRHPNIVSFVGICRQPTEDGLEKTYLVTEWVPKGNLSKLIKKHYLPWRKRVEMAVDMASALTFLHKKNLIHRDIKPQNMLITETEGVKICDFGFARKKPNAAKLAMTLAGTEDYMAPEVIMGMDYDEKCDVFSLGVVLLVLITRRKPPKRSPIDCFEFKTETIDELVPPDCPPLLKAIAMDCCNYSPQDRPSCSEVLAFLKRLLKEMPEDSAQDEAALKKLEEARKVVEDNNIQRIKEFISKDKATPPSSPSRPAEGASPIYTSTATASPTHATSPATKEQPKAPTQSPSKSQNPTSQSPSKSQNPTKNPTQSPSKGQSQSPSKSQNPTGQSLSKSQSEVLSQSEAQSQGNGGDAATIKGLDDAERGREEARLRRMMGRFAN